jgi:hypothetical protein
VSHPQRASLLEVVLDLGRRPEARFLGQSGGQFLREAEVGAWVAGWLAGAHMSCCCSAAACVVPLLLLLSGSAAWCRLTSSGVAVPLATAMTGAALPLVELTRFTWPRRSPAMCHPLPPAALPCPAHSRRSRRRTWRTLSAPWATLAETTARVWREPCTASQASACTPAASSSRPVRQHITPSQPSRPAV